VKEGLSLGILAPKWKEGIMTSHGGAKQTSQTMVTINGSFGHFAG
jgi:transcription elongation factor